MACAPGALAQPRHALGAAQLQYLFNLREIHAEVEAGGRHHAAQRACAQAVFHLLPQCWIQRAMMQCQRVRVFRPYRRQRLVPQLGLRAGVGEQQAAAYGHQCVQHARQLRQAEMPRPRETFTGFRQQAAHADRARTNALYDRCILLARQQHVAGLRQVAQRGRQSPKLQGRSGVAQHRQVQLQQDAALVAQQFMPFVHHHAAQLAHAWQCVGIAQQQCQRFRRGHQYVDAAFAGLPALAVAGIAAAQADPPAQAQPVDHCLQRTCGITGQCPQRRHPQHLQRPHRAGPARCRRWIEHRLQQRAAEHGQRLAAAGGGVQQPGVARQIVPPHRALERQ